MVEYSLDLDTIFGALADPTRRDIFSRLVNKDHTVNYIAERYKISLAAVSKHIKILESAKLITRRKEGKYYHMTANTQTLETAYGFINQYKSTWNNRLDTLEQYLSKEE